MSKTCPQNQTGPETASARRSVFRGSARSPSARPGDGLVGGKVLLGMIHDSLWPLVRPQPTCPAALLPDRAAVLSHVRFECISSAGDEKEERKTSGVKTHMQPNMLSGECCTELWITIWIK